MMKLVPSFKLKKCLYNLTWNGPLQSNHIFFCIEICVRREMCIFIDHVLIWKYSVLKCPLYHKFQNRQLQLSLGLVIPLQKVGDLWYLAWWSASSLYFNDLLNFAQHRKEKTNRKAYWHSLPYLPFECFSADYQHKVWYCWTQALWNEKIHLQKKIFWEKDCFIQDSNLGPQ